MEVQTTAEIEYQENYQKYEQEQKKAIQKITQTKQTSRLKDKFYPLIELTKEAIKGNIPSLLVEGTGATGKTYNIIKTLEQEKADYLYMNTYTTPLELYKTLCQNKDKQVIIFDDIAGIWKDEKNIAILKSALWGMEGKRLIQYTSPKKEPDKFVLNASVIIITNKIPDNPHTHAIKTRMHTIELTFTHQEMLKLMKEIAKIPYKETTNKQREKVVKWIEDNLDHSHQINLRTLQKLFDISHHPKWTQLAQATLNPNPTIQAYLKAQEQPTQKEQIAHFTEQGYSRRTYFNIKKRMKSAKVQKCN